MILFLWCVIIIIFFSINELATGGFSSCNDRFRNKPTGGWKPPKNRTVANLGIIKIHRKRQGNYPASMTSAEYKKARAKDRYALRRAAKERERGNNK